LAVRDYFSDADLEAVRAATKEAERGTSGELVCVVVERSDRYDDARWRAAALGALAGGLLTAYGFYALEAWSPWIWIWPAVIPLLGAAATWVLTVTMPAIERELAGAEVLRQRVHDRAAAAFVSEQVFRTRGRTGVLVFLSLFERRVEILCDETIRNLVPASAWQDINSRLAAGIGEGRAGAALAEAVGACGRLLAEHGLGPEEDDRDELSDEVRIHEEE
jgi:putative membrane protein